METKFSRYAKRRAKLYNISDSIIIDIFKGKDKADKDFEIIYACKITWDIL